MNAQRIVEILFEALVAGDRPGARAVLAECFDLGQTPRTVLMEVLWPAYELVERLYRADHMTVLSHRGDASASGDGGPGGVTFRCRRGTVGRCCGVRADGRGRAEAQIAVDILESAGFRVSFAGGGVPSDEIMSQVHQSHPDVLLLFASARRPAGDPCDDRPDA